MTVKVKIKMLYVEVETWYKPASYV